MVNKFWGNGSGNFHDAAHWWLGSGMTGGATTVPGTGDGAVFDGHASGLNGGTVTVTAPIDVGSIHTGNMVGTFDNSVGNFDVICRGHLANFWAGNGAGIRTVHAGTGTYTMTGDPNGTNLWNMQSISNLSNPLTAFAGCNIILVNTDTTAAAGFEGGGVAGSVIYKNVTFDAHANKNGYNIRGANRFDTITVNGPNALQFLSSFTQIIDTAFIVNGAAASRVLLYGSTSTGPATISMGGSATVTVDYAMLMGLTGTGGASFVANNSYDMGRNVGWTINAPPAGGGGGGVIGG